MYQHNHTGVKRQCKHLRLCLHEICLPIRRFRWCSANTKRQMVCFVTRHQRQPSHYNEKVSCHQKRHTQVFTLDFCGEMNGQERVLGRSEGSRDGWKVEGHLSGTATKGKELERIMESPRPLMWCMYGRSLDWYCNSMHVNRITL